MDKIDSLYYVYSNSTSLLLMLLTMHFSIQETQIQVPKASYYFHLLLQSLANAALGWNQYHN